MKTNHRPARVTALNPSPVAIAAWDSRSPAISQKEKKRTKISSGGFAIFLSVFLGLCVTTDLGAQEIVVPNALETNDGNGSSTSAADSASVRWLHIHDASQFGSLSGPSFLTQFAYRPDQILGESGPRSLTLRIYASTTSRTVAEISTTFAENLGPDNTLVFDGTVNVATANLPGPGDTRQFDYVFPFTTPFLYDPAAGNLVLDLQIEASGSALTFDTVSGDPAIGRVFSAGSSTATTGDIRFSHVTHFTFEALPPLTAVLSGADIVISWKPGAVGVVLEVSEDLSADSWRIESGIQRAVADRVEVTIQTVDRRRFYRLRNL